MKILMKNFGVIEWIVIISVGVFLVFLLCIVVDAIIATMHGNVEKVIIKTVNGRKFSLKVPVRPTARQEKTKGEQRLKIYGAAAGFWDLFRRKKGSFLLLPIWDYPYSYLIMP